MAAIFTTEHYTTLLKALLPPGRAWPRETNAELNELLSAFAPECVDIDALMQQLLTESSPEGADALIDEWETEAGFPDDCYDIPASLEARRSQVLSRLIIRGSQSEKFFIQMAELLGYTLDAITYNSGFEVGASGVGDPIGGGSWLYTMEVWVDGAQANGGKLECVFNRLKRATRHILFHYTS